MLKPSQPCLGGGGQDPRDWNGSPQEAGFLLSVMAVSTLLWCTARTWGLGAAVLCWLHFFSLCAWLEAGLVPHYWACFSPFQVCPGTHTLVMGVSILKLVSLPAERTHWCTYSQWPQAGPQSKSALFLQSICTVIGNGSLHFSGEPSWSKRNYSRMAGEWLEWSWHGQRPRQFSICYFHTVTWSKRVFAHSLREQSQFLIAPWLPILVSTSAMRGLIILVLDPRVGVSNVWIEEHASYYSPNKEDCNGELWGHPNTEPFAILL